MYRLQSRWIAERATYLDSAAQDEQNEYLHHRISSIATKIVNWALESSKLAYSVRLRPTGRSKNPSGRACRHSKWLKTGVPTQLKPKIQVPTQSPLFDALPPQWNLVTQGPPHHLKCRRQTKATRVSEWRMDVFSEKTCQNLWFFFRKICFYDRWFWLLLVVFWVSVTSFPLLTSPFCRLPAWNTVLSLPMCHLRLFFSSFIQFWRSFQECILCTLNSRPLHQFYRRKKQIEDY